jgi:biopolymer transport protein ExbD
MRRFSQRQALVTLSDINITPLLDLAFVLLIIFVITTPLLEQGINLNLPVGGAEDTKHIEPKDVVTIDVAPNGQYVLRGYAATLDQAAQAIRQWHLQNPKLLFYVRADEATPYKFVAAILNRIEKAGIDEVSLRTEPPK